MAATDQPNIVILFADQLRADALGCYGNRMTDTPACDSLAASGTRYDAAYTPSPVCVPARSAFITGLEPQHGECFDNEMPMSQATTFMDELTTAGYRTHGVGKMHFTPDGASLRGFQTRDTGEEFGTPETDDYLDFVASRGFDHVEHPHGLRDEMYYVPQLSPVPEELHHSHWVADRSIAFLDQHDQNRPFLLWSSFIAPHPPFAPPSPWHRRFEPSAMPDPFIPQGSDGLLTVFNRLQNRYKYRDGGTDRRLEQLRSAYYFASVSYLDSQIARILRALDDVGCRENTVILLSADHGEFLGDYGAYGKRSFLDVAARVPLIINGPGFSEEVRNEPVSLIDVRPTLLELAGIDYEERDGAALVPQPPAQRAIYGQFQDGELGLYAVITHEWKYIWSAFDRAEFLIDRIRDPRETRNLAFNPRRREVVEDMRARARAHFDDLTDTDFAALSANGPLPLGERPSEDLLRALRALERDPEASTLVVRGGPWIPDRPGA
ncbi:sulfatase-like hydrolase/transferase [Microbacterium sp. SSW1-59]|uniref:sulfatase family protein n=1 Tax=Microbacterium xanthum TaxID=3079794 RepID=UPI002AD2D73A|nr:sulfatase-like hydrolase/transferase [Microbacterium sp. SSW1-59]MDZ8201679.1 sulfatase-like hydrolase/transferase [Microbacterium sp. SSW1-59]